MYTQQSRKSRTLERPLLFLVCLNLTGILVSCNPSTNPPGTVSSTYTETNLVSDTAVFAPAYLDPQLANAWGIAFSSTGKVWISSNHGSVSTIYDVTGATLAPAVAIPGATALAGGAPTGIVFNASDDFDGNKFIFSTEDGTIAGWKSGPSATIVSDQSARGVIYKGLTSVASMGLLYATDFHNNRVDVYDRHFALVSHFTDPSVPPGFAPFGIQNIGNLLYVTFARQKSDAVDDSAGMGIGFVDRFTPTGVMIGRFAMGGHLNSPWAIALAPQNFGQFANAILIGNFGDGKITGFDRSGRELGQLRDNAGRAIAIEGLWALSFNPAESSSEHADDERDDATTSSKLYFTAGPYDEEHGLFGYLSLAMSHKRR